MVVGSNLAKNEFNFLFVKVSFWHGDEREKLERLRNHHVNEN